MSEKYMKKWERYCETWDAYPATSAKEMLFAHCVKMDEEIDTLRKELAKTRGQLTREKKKNDR
jgi:hypothetical protein